MALLSPLSRRTLLRGAGACLALPLLEAMSPRRLSAQEQRAMRFIAFFYPNGTDPGRFNPPEGPLSAERLPPCLVDLAGYAAEGPFPAGGALWSEITAVTGIDHSGVCVDIHMPSMALSAHKGVAAKYIPPEPTLDQYLAARLQAGTPFRNLALAATPSTDIGQGNISFRAGGQVETVVRTPRQLFEMLFKGRTSSAAPDADARTRQREASLLDGIREDAKRLSARLGAADRQRIDQYLQAISELEKQLGADGERASACTPPSAPEASSNWHTKSKQFIDLMVLAMACDLTRVATLQYSDSWGVNYADYSIGTGRESLGSWSDHFISHKLDDSDRATDLDGLERNEAKRIADARVVLTSRFKVRRFSYLVEALQKVSTPTGTLLDESLVLYASENGDGDSHARTNMPVLLAGHVGGFRTGRAIAASGQPTGALHASILRQFGLDVPSYGNPAGKPLATF